MVAIVGVMSTMAGGAMQALVALGRVNGAAGSMTRMLANARMRAAAMRCRVSVQLNGPNYRPTGVALGAPITPSSITVFRKGSCDAANGFFEPGDRVLALFPLTEPGVSMLLPPSITTAPQMDNNAVLLSWGEGLTGTFDRDVWLDSGAGTFSQVPGAPLVTISFASHDARRATCAPPTGTPYLD